ncbi:MAG: hypothetical protein PVH78_05460 [Deltaproteobacteria bacterium]
MGRDFRRPEAGFIGRLRIVYLLCAALWLLFFCAPAWAHKVMIFAWVEGDTIYTQSKFSGGKRAKNATVVVYDKEGNQLLAGETDEKGEFSFKVPKRTDLKIALKASMGHLAEWTIPVEEMTPVLDGAEGSPPEVGVQVTTKGATPLTGTKTAAEPPAPAAAGLSRQEIQTLIDESLDRKLTPIVKMLADQVGRGPTVNEVLCGIGYIFGLAGVALYFMSRRKG